MTVVPPPPRRTKNGILIGSVIAVVILLMLAAWALLIGMPFRGPQKLQRTETVVSTVGEDTSAPVGTPDLGVPPPTTTTAAPLPPPVIVETAPPVTTTEPAPMPMPMPVPPPLPAPTPAPPPPTPQPQPQADEITEDQAVEVLRGYTRGYYTDVDRTCLGITSHGYVNVGYTLEVVDRCAGTSLGNWRVDSKTREVFKQNADGRYVRP
jgi:hypothetical protein